MPTLAFFFNGPDDFILSGETVVTESRLKLRQTDANGDFDRGGTFKSGSAIFPTKHIERLDDFFSFEAVDKGGGTLLWQLSGDDGTTFLWHDGAYWVEVASDADANTTDEVAENIGTFPKSFGRDFKLKAILQGSTDGKQTPIVTLAELHFELTRYDFTAEIERSLKRKLVEKLSISEIEAIKALLTTTDTIELRTDYETVIGVDAVYNLTDDPNRANNLLFSFTAPKTVKLLSAQAAGKTIEIQFRVRPRLVLAADPDYTETSLPVIVIETPTIVEQRERRIGDLRVEKNIPLRKARTRAYFVHQAATVLIRCAAPQKMQVARIVDGVSRVFQFTRSLPNIASGEVLDVVDFSPITENNLIQQELRERDISLTVVGRAWVAPEFTERPLVEKIQLGLGDFKEKFEETSIQ